MKKTPNWDAFREANERLRSAYAIAKRDGKSTNWKAWRKLLHDTLRKQHAVMYPSDHNEQASRLLDKASKLGLDYPTEAMIAEELSAACFNAVLEAGGHELLIKWLGAGLKKARLQMMEEDLSK